MHQPKEVKEEYIKREERKLGTNRVSTTCIYYLLLCPPPVCLGAYCFAVNPNVAMCV